MNEIIVLNKVGKVYPGKVPVIAVQDVSLKIYGGNFVAIQGPSASGKTTLLMIIGTLSKPTKGKVYINGIDVTTLSDDEIAKIRNNYIGISH
jgi:putative ABC transport system ATP-binding protein